jgi:AcrR family transcriptional regulator
MAPSPRSNRGPGAASENRAALIAAARTVFATHGLDAPLNAVAREAGVGQGSLYRHFPTRYALAIAVFQDNLREFEGLAAEPSSTLDGLLREMTILAIRSTAFFEMIEVERADDAGLELARRVRAVISSKLPAAQTEGLAPEWITADDVMLGVAMLSGALSKAAVADRPAVAERVWMLLPFGPRSS